MNPIYIYIYIDMNNDISVNQVSENIITYEYISLKKKEKPELVEYSWLETYTFKHFKQVRSTGRAFFNEFQWFCSFI